MRMLLLAGVLLAVARPSLAAGDPLAPARAGKQLCFTPDEKAKTCRSLIAYSFGPGATIRAQSDTVVTENGPIIIMRRSSEVALKGDAVCRKVGPEDVEKATYLLSGKPAAADTAKELRQELRSQYAPLFGKEFCNRYQAAGVEFGRPASGFIVTLTIDGVAQPDVTDTAVWLDAKAGWRVAP